MRTPPIFTGCTALAITLAAGAPASAADVHWKNADHMPAMQASHAPLDDLARLAQRPDAPRVLVRFDEALSAAQRDALNGAGLRVLAPLGEGVYFARPSRALNTARVAAVAPLAHAAPIAIEHKLDERYLLNAPPEWAFVPREARDIDDARPGELVGAYVLFHTDTDALAPGAMDLVTDLGGAVLDTLETVNGLVIDIPLANVRALASDDRVQWVEPPLPRFGTFNASNRAITQADQAQAAPYNLDGSGVTVFVYDGGSARATHQDFSGRTTVIDSSSVSFHATHVAGTVGGDGSVLSTHTGMAPGVDILSAGFEWDGVGIFFWGNPGDIETDYATALSMGADISNNSIGANVGPNGLPCSIEGDYGVTAAVIDSIITGGLGDTLTIFWSAGNERGNGCGDNHYTSPPPTNNKNAITVGALNSNDDSVTSFTSWGPSDDGRLRPVISGPGCQSGGDGGVTSTGDGSDTDYITLCGTSMSGPTLAGLGALILEDFRATFTSEPDPANHLMKVWMCHAAADIVNPGPDYQTGYGSARVVDTIDFMRTGAWDTDAVDHNDSALYSINVSPSDTELKVTLAWDDVPGAPNVLNTLVNDLDLVVIDPSGNRHFPWTLDPNHPEAPATRDREDHLNNIEQVLVDNPAAGTWTIAVRGTSVPSGPQAFAIGASPALGSGLIGLDVVSAFPQTVAPATPITVDAVVVEGTDTLVPGSVTLNYRFDAGSFLTAPMTLGAGVYSADIPGATCGDTVEYFVSAQGNTAGTLTDPQTPASVDVGAETVALTEDFESAPGWTVTGVTGTGVGGWQLGTPVGGGDRGDPALDADGSGQCYLTGNGAGNTDVDDGTTTLTSPDLDATTLADPYISYARWYHNQFGASPGTDTFTVEISDNAGATWTALESVGPSGAGTHGGWVTASFRIADFVTPTDQIRLRFNASDLGAGSVVEAGVDAIRISAFECEVTACGPADIDGDGDVDPDDIAAFVNLFTGPGLADIDNDGDEDPDDIAAFVDAFVLGC